MFSIPSFSLPISRTDYNNVTTMLTNFFISQGLSGGDAAAQAGLVLNLKQQGYTDAQINQAIATQQNTLNSITASNVAAAKAALAAETPTVAAAKQAMQNATLEHATKSGSGNVLITIDGVTQTRDQAANFTPTDIPMCADPDNPRGAKIPCSEANKKLAEKSYASYSNSEVANLPATSKVVAINDVPVSDSKPKTTVTTTSDVIKTAMDAGTSASKSVISALNSIGATITGGVETISKDLGLSPQPATTELKLTKVTINSKTTTGYKVTEYFSDGSKVDSNWTQKTLDNEKANGVQVIDNTNSNAGSGSTNTTTDPIKQLTDFFANLFKSPQPATSQPQQTPSQTQQPDLIKQAQDAIAAGEKALTDTATNAVTTITGMLGKLTAGNSLTTTDPTKTSGTPQPAISDQQPPIQQPSTETQQQQPTTDQQPQQTTSQIILAYLKKYSIPIVIGIGATASLGIALSHNRKQGIIAK